MRNTRVLPSLDANNVGKKGMPILNIRFNERDTMPDLLEQRAGELDITVEQLVKRFISTGMRDYQSAASPAVTGESLDDFFVQNGVLKPK